MVAVETHRNRPIIRIANIVVIVAIIAAVVTLRMRIVREERVRAPVAPGTSISIFVTSALCGYREPCG
jgi:hypothetical protein